MIMAGEGEKKETKMVPVYPEAPSKVVQYENLLASLQTERANIYNAYVKVKNIKNTYSNAVKTGNVSGGSSNGMYCAEGAYFDTYSLHSDNWFDALDDIVSKAYNFISDLDYCISRAQSMLSMWEGRRGMYREEEV